MSKYQNMNKYSPEEYKEIFKQILADGVPIYQYDQAGNRGKQLIIREDEIFLQCYDPEDETRKNFPPCWFISEHGDVINVSDPKKPEWKRKYWKKESKSYIYNFPITLDDGRIMYRNIPEHNLRGLVFGSYRFGKAQTMLDKEGLSSFGIRRKAQPAVNGHHIDENKKNNNHDNIEFVSTEVHTLMDQIPKIDADDETEIKFMQQFSKLMDSENPDGVTVLAANPKMITDVPKDSKLVEQIKDYLSSHLFVVESVKEGE